MSTTSLSRKAKASALVPLALLSGVYTASLLSTSATAVNTSATPRNLPDGTTVPTKAIEAPASVPVPGVVAPAVPQGAADAVVSGASTSGIPAPALSAYQRAAQIIDAADKSCNIPWELIGAIGRVESDHGRYNGNSIDSKGFSRPGIYGIPLNGKNGTQAIRDTDGGQLDKDPVFDRAVGPMQFIPSTWQVVKVDADGDGQRNPQDMNDAALATAVYLCSGSDNLGTRKGQEASVLRYNHSQDYVNLVLRIMEAYTSGDYSAIPSGTQAGTSFSSSSSSYSSAISRSYQKAAAAAKARAKAAKSGGGSGSGSGSGLGSGSSSSGVTGGSTSTGGSTIPGTSGGSSSTGGSVGGTVGGVVKGVTGGIKKAVTPSNAPAPSTPTPVKQVLSLAQAKVECAKKYNAVTQAADFTKCVTSLTS